MLWIFREPQRGTERAICDIPISTLSEPLGFSFAIRFHASCFELYRDIIMQCLDDKDEFIRRRALDLIVGMVS